jgi:hypothetical protein
MNINSSINNNIILVYNIDTVSYNNKIINELSKDINYICNTFDSICIDTLIKLFIMYKREKKSKNKKIYEPYIRLILKLKKMDHVNIKNYFECVIDILRIIKKKSKIEKFILLNYNNRGNVDSVNVNIDSVNVDGVNVVNVISSDKYININYLNNTFIQVINNIAIDNLIISTIADINKKSANNIDSIIKLSTLLCSEFYYLYNAVEMYNIVKTVITMNRNYKNSFINNYNDVNKKLIYIYENDNLEIKNYKLECNKNVIIDILKNVKSILKK